MKRSFGCIRDPWLLTHRLSALCVSLPFIFLAVQAAAPANENWRHIREWLLRTYFLNTLVVTFSGVLIASVIGVPLAWITCLFAFPGKSFMEWALVLPLAIPPYISAYIYYHLMSYTGGFQVGLRTFFGLDVNRFGFDIPPPAFAVFIFATTLFPYVYLVVKAFLKNQSASLYENTRLLGRGAWSSFFGVFMPLMAPSIAGGATLVALEILSDFGVTSHFGIHTFSTAIFSAWFGMSDTDSAAKMSVMLLGAVFILSAFNKLAQRASKYRIVSGKERALSPRVPPRRVGLACTFFCIAVLFFSVVIPLGQLFSWLTLSWNPEALPRLCANAWNTIRSAITATCCTMILATGTVNATRLFPSKANLALAQFAAIGYSVPGAVLAMGVISLFSFIPRAGALFGVPDFLDFSRTTVMLIFSYVIRFFAIGFHAVESGFAKVGNIHGEVSRTLGAGPGETFFRVEMPLIRNAVISGFVLVFMDIMKELPLTLILRPFNFNTLGTSVYDFAKNEIMEQIALPAILIIALCAAFIAVASLLDKPYGRPRSEFRSGGDR
jgi:iron(III) transport system permease protein